MHILSLPGVMLEHIFSFLTYDQVAKNRIVCKDFDVVCQRVLNRGFQIIERQISTHLRGIKTQLPRRESERRFHPLARHCDILTSVETRISMLNMAYKRFIEQGKCCFIPGKILDEMRHVMAIVDRSDPLPMAFEVLQELRDISGMAMEHFEEVVAPTLRQKPDDYSSRLVPLSILRSDLDRKSPKTAVGTSLEMALLREACLRNNKSVLKIEKRCRLLTRKLELYKRLMTRNKQQLVLKQMDQNLKIAELKKKVEEYEIRFNEFCLASGFKNKDTDLLKRVNNNILHAKTNKALLIKNFGSQIKLDPSISSIGANKGRKASPIIKPRKASLNLPSYKSDDICVDSLSDCSDLAECSDIKKKTADKTYEDSMMAIHQQLHKVALLPKMAKRKDKCGSLKNTSSKYPWINKLLMDRELRETSPLPSTSKASDNQIIDLNKRKRNYNDEFDKNSALDNETYTGKGFHAKVQLLSKTIMKLIDSIQDNNNSKRRRTEGGQE